MIKFTIVTCTYNAANTCQRTFDSVIAQTYPYVEHLIIDGNSKDGTLPLAWDYMEENAARESLHDISITSEPDKGLYDAMNKGIAKATGDYILFLNAGDTFPNLDTLEQIANDIGEGEQLPAVLYGDTDIVDERGNFIRHRRLSPPQNLSWRSFKQGMLVCHQAFYARTDIAKQTPFDLRYRFSADVDWCIRIMKEAENQDLPLKNIGMVVANFLDEGMTTHNHKASLWERFRLMSHHYGIVTTFLMHLWFAIRTVWKQ
ncbi:MAG: glycosyltransferase [Prevotella sp.]|nr:glycosyltransferase [Prevotella sp.]